MTRFVTTLAVIVSSFTFFGQSNFDGLPVQIQFNTVNFGSVDLKVLITDTSSDTIWLEHHLNTPINSHSAVIDVGEGIFLTGQSNTFSEISFIDIDKIEIYDITGGNDILLLNSKLHPFVFSFHSLYAEIIDSLSKFTDVDAQSTVLTNHLLKWGGSDFELNYDFISDSAGFANQIAQVIFTDTALYALLQYTMIDSSVNSNFSDTVMLSINTLSSLNAYSSTYTDTSLFTYFAFNNWSLQGNTNVGSQFVGTTTNNQLAFRTNALGRFFITSEGYISNSTNANSSLFLENSFLAENNVSSDIITITSSPFLFFNGGNSAFIGGRNTTNYSSDTAYFINSFSWGENSFVKGQYSTSFGKNNIIRESPYSSSFDGSGSFAFGENAIVGHHSFAIGKNADAGHRRNVAIGRNVTASVGSASAAIGSNAIATGVISNAFGFNVTADGNYSTVLGTNASSNGFTGSFIYGDNSTSSIVNNTANNEFMTRTSGGAIFYTSPNLLTGVELPAGGGSWNMVSDRNIKQNFEILEGQKVMSKIQKIEVTSWQYKTSTSRHIGPMAQDFYRSFDVGESKKLINTLDIDGIVLYGISNVNTDLNQKTLSNQSANQLNSEIDDETNELKKLKERIKVLENEIEN